MENFPLNKNLNKDMKKLTENDPVHADTFNPLFEQLINNDAKLDSTVSTFTSQLADKATKTDIDDRGANLKSLGLKGDANTNDTTALSNALNSFTPSFFAPAGEYILKDTIIVNSAIPKVITGTEGTVFKITLSSSKTLFDLLSNVTFKNIELDFSNTYCKSVFTYRKNFGVVKLTDIKVKNIKDDDSVTSSTLINIPAEGNKLEIDNIEFKNILKRGNGLITDSSGSLNGIYYNGVVDAPGGAIRRVHVENFHNINNANAIILEDTAGVYVALNGKKSNLKIENITGYEFGKRLLKIQASDIDIDKIKGESTTGDTLSVVGALSEPGLFHSSDVRISDVIARGNMDYAIATASSETIIKDCQISLYGSNALNNGSNQFGIFLTDEADNSKIKNCRITAKRPIGLFNSTSILKNIQIEDTNLSLLSNSTHAISQDFTGKMGFDGLSITNLLVKGNASHTSNPTIMATESSFLGRNKNLSINNARFEAIDPVGTTYVSTACLVIRFTDGVFINGVSYTNNQPNAVLADGISIENCTNVELDRITIANNSNRTIRSLNVNGIKIKNLNLKDAMLAHLVFIETINAEIDSKNEQYKFVYGTQDATEIMRNKGITAQRPKRAYQSYRYFDTTLFKDIIVKSGAVVAPDGTVTTLPIWVDAMGALV